MQIRLDGGIAVGGRDQLHPAVRLAHLSTVSVALPVSESVPKSNLEYVYSNERAMAVCTKNERRHHLGSEYILSIYHVKVEGKVRRTWRNS